MKRLLLFRPAIALAFLLLGILIALLVDNLTPADRELHAPVTGAVSVGDPAFERNMSGLYGTRAFEGSRIETLINGNEIFPAMLEAIERAEWSVNFETYVYWSGATAEAFADALSERAQAGVEVRVLLDWNGSLPMDQALIERMESAGAQVVR